MSYNLRNMIYFKNLIETLEAYTHSRRVTLVFLGR